jgi:ferredoxin
MSQIKVNLHREWCIASGACVTQAPRLFAQDDNGLVVLRVTEIDPADHPALHSAAAACPAAVIEIEQDREPS